MSNKGKKLKPEDLLTQTAKVENPRFQLFTNLLKIIQPHRGVGGRGATTLTKS